MLKIIKIALVVVFFALPVNAEHLLIVMIVYLCLGISASVGSFVYCALILTAAAYLLVSSAFVNGRRNNIFSFVSALLLLVPVGFEMSKRNQFVSAWSVVTYGLFFVLIVILFIRLLRGNKNAN